MILTAVAITVGTLVLGALAVSGRLARQGRQRGGEGDQPLVAARGTRFGEVSAAAPARLRVVSSAAVPADPRAADRTSATPVGARAA